MPNVKYNALAIKTVCENKLGIHFRDGSEFNGWFLVNGKKIARITIPHGRKSIPFPTYKSMAAQMKLLPDQFSELIECSLSLEMYIDILREQKLVD